MRYKNAVYGYNIYGKNRAYADAAYTTGWCSINVHQLC